MLKMIVNCGEEKREMEIDWNEVKKVTLWSYEALIEKILHVLSYNFIQEHYNHNMKEAGKYVRKLFGNDLRERHAEYVRKLFGIFRNLDSLGVKNYAELVHQVESRQKCEEFLKQTKLPFKDLLSVLNHVFRWVLPHNLYLSELVDKTNETYGEYLKGLSKIGIRFNLDVLEHGRTREGREKISKETGVPKVFIIDLVNRADMSRLPYSNRKTMKHLCEAGYGSVDKLAQADAEKTREDMKSYFARKGIKLAGFIDLDGIAQWAKTMPKIVKK